MPLPPIAVEVAPPAKDQTLVQVLLDACGRAANPVTCVDANAVDSGGVSALAIVVWLPGAEGVRIQVGAKRGQQQGDWVNRKITFEPSDEERERWTAAGFVVGTLASRFIDVSETPAESEIHQVEPEATEEKSEAPPSPPPTPIPVEPSASSLWVDGGAVFGPMLDTGPWRFGAMLGVAYQGDDWPMLLHTSIRHSWRPRDSDVVVRVSEAEFGGGVTAGAGNSWTARVLAGLAVERLYGRLDDPRSAGPQLHWVVGGRARADLGLWIHRPFGAFVSGGFSLWSHRTAFVKDDEVLGQQQLLVGELLVGVRYELASQE